MINKQFEGLEITLASAADVEEWSHGQVKLPDTINYRTGKPKPAGLFCEQIFGPTKNFECSCGKYKGARYRGIVCERCGVEVTTARVRRERMGHINLAAPVAHIWYVKATPSRFGLLLEISAKEIEKILYFVKYVVTEYDETKKQEALSKLDETFAEKTRELETIRENELQTLRNNDTLKENERAKKTKQVELLFKENTQTLDKEYHRVKSILASLKVGSTVSDTDHRNIFSHFSVAFTFASGAEALQNLLAKIDIEKDIQTMLHEFDSLKQSQKDKAYKRLRLLINLLSSGVSPSSMILTKIPVLPPDLRPVVQLDGGKFASSDINYFYRRVLMRNQRLKKMIDNGMPDVIKKNEIRLLQESINNLFVGDKTAATKPGGGTKVYKSFTDILSGKDGRFRKNLLGKRVDFSGRSIITPGPELKLDECGLPLYVATKMFTPFVISKLIKLNLAHTPKQAEKFIKEEHPVALRLLREVIDGKYVLLNRAPTLHRLGIQAFKIKLVPGKTIRIHPLITPAFNADFDGDQMAIHLPLTKEAQQEAEDFMSSVQNILKPASGEPVISHTLDMVLGMYTLTFLSANTKDEDIVGNFSHVEDVINHFNRNALKISDLLRVFIKGEYKITTVGRVIFNAILPDDYEFINETINGKGLVRLLDKIYDKYGRVKTVEIANTIKDLGFQYATHSGNTMNVFDMTVPKEKKALLDEGDQLVKDIHNRRFKGFLSDEEKHDLIINNRSNVKSQIDKAVVNVYKEDNDLTAFVTSGAKGNWALLGQLSGMKGLVASPSGEIIELPIKSSLIEGFSPIEYFISAHGARKGKADTALRTAESGYLTRRLCDASQDVIVKEHDCNSVEGIFISKEEIELSGSNFFDEILGRITCDDIQDEEKNVLIEAGTMIDKQVISQLKNANIDLVRVRSPLTCITASGVCQKCFGMDLSKRALVRLGVAAGIISSQSLGEPATQLTMRTFHSDKTATEEDITHGVKRVEELFEVRKPKRPAIIAPFDGTVKLEEKGNKIDITVISEPHPETYFLKEGYESVVTKGEKIKKGGIYATQGRSKLKVKNEGVVLDVEKEKIIVGVTQIVTKSVLESGIIKVKDGDAVITGEQLTSGPIDVKEYKQIVGDIEAQRYIVREINKVYASQGQDVNNKYMEVIVKQMFSKVLIEDSGDTMFIPGSVVRFEEFIAINEALEKEGKRPALGDRLVLGLTQVAKETSSWLSAASFQETMRVLVDASTKGSIDMLDDLKSNVIVGKLLPLGKEYKGSPEHKEFEEIVVQP